MCTGQTLWVISLSGPRKTASVKRFSDFFLGIETTPKEKCILVGVAKSKSSDLNRALKTLSSDLPSWVWSRQEKNKVRKGRYNW